MPASYTHYSFGEAVYNNLSRELQKVIDGNRTIYNIGLNGPDILFYYKPLSKNPINILGHKMHKERAYEFFNNAKKHIVEHKREEAIPYILGFICHFILDSNCHPYIAEAMRESGISHEEIEAELDGRTMRANNLSPQAVNAGNHIIATKEAARIIAEFYKQITEKQIYTSLKSVKFYNELLLCQNNLKRNIIKGGLGKIKGGTSFSHMIINVVPNPNSKYMINKLMMLYENSINEATQMVEEYYGEMMKDAPINKRFNRNFE